MISATDEKVKAAIESAKAAGTQVGDATILDELEKATIVNVAENVWEKDDEFELPATKEELIPFLCKDTYTNLPRRSDGKYPVGYSVLVYVKNPRTGAEGFKRFRPNQPANSIPEYHWDEAQSAYMSTGNMFGPKNELAKQVANARTQGARLAIVLGKKLKVTDMITGDQAVRKDRVVVGVQRKSLPEFTIVG